MRRLRRILACSLYTLTLLSFAPYSARAETAPVIYIARRGWHIDVGFAGGDLSPILHTVAANFGEQRYVFFGFGDQHYLLAAHHSAPTLAAALWPGPGVLLVTALQNTPAEAFGAPEGVETLHVTPAQLRAAERFVEETFVSIDGEIRVYHAGPYAGTLYFAAAPQYWALHTCNTWAAETLAAAGMPIPSRGIIFAGQLWKRVRRLENARP